MDALEDRMKILDTNINLHLKLMGKIQSMQAMEMRGVEEEQIDTVLLEFDAQLEEYESALKAGELVDSRRFEVDSAEEQALEELEAEILGGKTAPAGNAPAANVPEEKAPGEADHGAASSPQPDRPLKEEE